MALTITANTAIGNGFTDDTTRLISFDENFVTQALVTGKAVIATIRGLLADPTVKYGFSVNGGVTSNADGRYDLVERIENGQRVLDVVLKTFNAPDPNSPDDPPAQIYGYDYESLAQHTITITGKSSNGTGPTVDSRQFLIDMRDVNEAPFDIRVNDTAAQNNVVAITVAENVAFKGILTGQDLDASGAEGFNLVYSFEQGGNPSGLFSIAQNQTTGDWELTAAAGAIDWDTNPNLIVEGQQKYYKLLVKATDGGGALSDPTKVLSTTQEVRVYVTNDTADDANLPPTAPTYTGTPTVAENAASTATLVQVTGSADPEGGAVTYQLAVGGNPGNRFAVSTDGKITLATGVQLDYEAADLVSDGNGGWYYSVHVVAKDAAGNLSPAKEVKVYVTDVNEEASAVTFSGAQTVKVGAGADAAVIKATAVDNDRTAAFKDNKYAFLVGTTLQATSADGLFKIDAATGQITTTRAVVAGDDKTYNLSVVAYDSGDNSIRKVVAQNVTVQPADTLPNQDPVITVNAAKANVPATDVGPGVRAFWGVTLADADTANLTLTIEFKDGDGLIEFAGEVEASTVVAGRRVYTWQGSAATLNEKLQALTFNPTDRPAANSTPISTDFIISLNDGVKTDRNYQVKVDTQVIGNTDPTATLPDSAKKLITLDKGALSAAFRSIELKDLENDNMTLEVSFNDGEGDLDIPSGITPQMRIENGKKVYTLKGKPAALDVMMDTVRFNAVDRPDAEIGSVSRTVLTVRIKDLVDGHDWRPPVSVEVHSVATKVELMGNHKVLEDAEPNTAVGGLTQSFTDLVGEVHNFAYQILNDDGRFSIGADGHSLVVNKGYWLDFEQATKHTVRLKVSVGDDSFEQDFELEVTDAPTEDVVGSDANETFKAGAGLDKLNGAGGNDMRFGGLGNDTLTGGAGQDKFVFDTRLGSSSLRRNTNLDTITDFKVGEDKIVLDDVIFKKFTAKILNEGMLKTAAYFRLGTKAKDKNDYLVYNKNTGILYYDSDGSGRKAAVAIAKFDKGTDQKFPVLGYQDFLII